jgi:glycosyltransferase involved in cell wall biosynthesis
MAHPQFDISLVINAHSEGRLLHPTLKSALEAIACARDGSLSVQLLIVLDSPDSATREYCAKFLPSEARVVEVSVKDAGLARNAGVETAEGRFIAFLDGDDLLGRNWLLAAHRFITAEARELILHPSLIVYFEGRNAVWRLLDQDDPGFSKAILLEHNLWPALSFGRRSTYRAVPFRAADRQNGFGYEDWLFNCDTVARGIVHRVVPHTVHCVRQKTRKHSVLHETAAAQSVIADSDLFSLSWR